MEQTHDLIALRSIRVKAARTDEAVRIFFYRLRNIAVVDPVIVCLHQHGLADAEAIHLRDERIHGKTIMIQLRGNDPAYGTVHPGDLAISKIEDLSFSDGTGHVGD